MPTRKRRRQRAQRPPRPARADSTRAASITAPGAGGLLAERSGPPGAQPADAAITQIPEAARRAMLDGGIHAACLPVRLGDARDGSDPASWQAAMFVQVAGVEGARHRQMLRARAGRPLVIDIECDLIETEQGSVVLLLARIHTGPGEPLQARMLLTPGAGGDHLEALQLLARQPLLSWFFAADDFSIVHSQCHPMAEALRAAFVEILADSARHDALMREQGSLDPSAALDSVIRHYSLAQSPD
ncbi:MAG: hypothetical protein KDK91_17330 [Gammaproteobacteria bacterium]|nr:hypothetical protein [Gammaproteobacteria bacterium]